MVMIVSKVPVSALLSFSLKLTISCDMGKHFRRAAGHGSGGQRSFLSYFEKELKSWAGREEERI